jgi:hypothetical protein
MGHAGKDGRAAVTGQQAACLFYWFAIAFALTTCVVENW